MKAATLVGILLIILGIAGFAMGGVSFTHEKKDVDLEAPYHQAKDTLRCQSRPSSARSRWLEALD